MIFPAEGTLAAKGGGSLMAILCQGIREDTYKMPLEMLSALQHMSINVSYIEYALYLVLF